MAKIPSKNAEIAALGVRVVTAWANYPTLDMDWITQADAVTLTTNYYNILLQTSQTAGVERIKVQAMRELDEEINTGYYDMLKGRISREYELAFDKDKGSSFFVEGYPFAEVA